MQRAWGLPCHGHQGRARLPPTHGPPGPVPRQGRSLLSAPLKSPGPLGGQGERAEGAASPAGARPAPSSVAYLMSALSWRSSRLRFRGTSSLSTTPEGDTGPSGPSPGPRSARPSLHTPPPPCQASPSPSQPDTESNHARVTTNWRRTAWGDSLGHQMPAPPSPADAPELVHTAQVVAT